MGVEFLLGWEKKGNKILLVYFNIIYSKKVVVFNIEGIKDVMWRYLLKGNE